MAPNPKIHVVIGPSTAGKTTLLEQLEQRDDFSLITKGTTRAERPDDQGITHLDRMDQSLGYDLGYLLYGNFYGCKSTDIEDVLAQGKNPLVIFNSFQGIRVLRHKFGDQVVATYIHRPLSEDDLRSVLWDRKQRFDSAEAFERALAKRNLAANLLLHDYGNFSHLIDGVLLNAGTLPEFEEQIDVLFTPDYERTRIATAPNHLFLVAGASDSGKRLLMEHLTHFGGGDVVVAKKQTTRQRRSTDGVELESVDTIAGQFDLRYGQHGSEYGINTGQIAKDLGQQRYVFLVVSDDKAVASLRNRFRNSSVIYLHRDVDQTTLDAYFEREGITDPTEIASRLAKKERLFQDYRRDPKKYDGVLINSYGPEGEIANQAIQLLFNMRGM